MKMRAVSANFVVLLITTMMEFNLCNTEYCVDYLISGFNGVHNDNITASSVYSSEHNAWRIRLFNTDYKSDGEEGVWVPKDSDTQQYIQISFNRMVTVSAIVMQGRITREKWVSSFYLKYSNDSVSWSTYNDAEGNPLLISANTDKTTIKTMNLDRNVTAQYFRINPQSWQQQIAMRLDFIGCQAKQTNSINQATYVFAPISSSVLDTELFSDGLSFRDCSVRCYREENCVSFSYEWKSSQCNGYVFNLFTNTLMSFHLDLTSTLPTHLYYFDKAMANKNGYITDNVAGLSFKIYTTRRTRHNAETACMEDLSYLLAVKTLMQLSVLASALQNSTILANEAGVYVAGDYLNGMWTYGNAEEIVMNLWSDNGRNETVGTCITVTQSGLNSSDCYNDMYFVCGY